MVELRSEYKELTKLICLGIIITFIISLAFKDFLKAIKFTGIYLLLFYIPISVWVFNKKLSLIEKFILINMIGLGIVPIVYLIISNFFLPLNNLIYVLIPMIILALGIYKNVIKVKGSGVLMNSKGEI